MRFTTRIKSTDIKHNNAESFPIYSKDKQMQSEITVYRQ